MRDVIKEIAESEPITEYGELDYLFCFYCSAVWDADDGALDGDWHKEDCLWLYCREQVERNPELLGMKVVVSEIVPDGEVWVTSSKAIEKFANIYAENDNKNKKEDEMARRIYDLYDLEEIDEERLK